MRTRENYILELHTGCIVSLAIVFLRANLEIPHCQIERWTFCSSYISNYFYRIAKCIDILNKCDTLIMSIDVAIH
jgi:multisubunit Na+/H+ antiporter MnhE subunit